MYKNMNYNYDRRKALDARTFLRQYAGMQYSPELMIALDSCADIINILLIRIDELEEQIEE